MDHDSLIRCADFRPRRLVEPDSWIGHAPFADWLMQTLRPQRFVELGTHTGNSYFAFCQAREQASLTTRCYAVDTWQGDSHAGFYEEDIYRDVEQYNNCNYAAFSRLMRMPFDEAQGFFADGSIDLLHIDGLHTFESVEHDFEHWLPKLTTSAVVLFHDTNVRIDDFGVWRYWEKLANEYPLHLEFLHSNGLGVLQLGDCGGRLALDWLIPDSVEQRLVSDYFTARGAHVADQFQIIRLHSQSAKLEADAQTRDARIRELAAEVDARDQHIDTLNQEVNASHEAIDRLGAQLRETRVRVMEVLSSTSWRLTAPVRFLKEWGRARSALITSPESGPGPSTSEFDAEFYLHAYPDVRTAGLDPYEHYVNWGASSGRLPSLPVPRIFGALSDLDPTKPTVLIVSHEASRTGAPILSLNLANHLRHSHNVVGLVFADRGMLVELQRNADVMIGPFAEARNSVVTGLLLKLLFQTTRPTFAIVNSIEARSALPGLAALFVPSLCLVHEFSTYVRPSSGVSDAVLWASEVVFSASIVRSSAEDVCDALQGGDVPVLPQGRSLVPGGARSETNRAREAERVRARFRPASGADTVVILGAGSVQLRKGVDLFIACAGRVKALAPQTPFRFVWVGHGYDPINDFAYSVYLRDQLRRAGLEDDVVFVGEMEEIELAYGASDILFLSSRLDPLPNVAIDAAHFSRPIVCFDRATGMAEHLLSAGLEQSCVAPYLDIDGAARRLFDLIEDAGLRQHVGSQVGALASRVFNMDRYVASLLDLADSAVRLQEIEREDCALIEREGALALEFFARPGSPSPSLQDAIRRYVRSWATGVDLRKPEPGFHPGVYREGRGLSADHPDPLADFIRAGRPEGPWLTPVISPETPRLGTSAAALRRGLHIHAFHPELLPEIVDRLQGQALSLDLLVSVPSEEAAAQARRLLRPITRSQLEIRIVPNRGRDIGPFITEFGRLILDRYDLIGHVHTKKSPDMNDPQGAKQWADFLYENLLGGRHPMATRILDEFAADDRLGLVFPDDPNALGWTKNKPIADELAAQLGLGALPERHFQFPIGTMFWARVSSLRPLLELDWEWDVYPEEPLPYDGTLLHAIERLLPSVSGHTGYGIATTYVPGVTR